MVLEKTLESPLYCKEIQPVNRKGNWSWIFIEKTDAEAEMPILWPPDAKNWLIWKDPDAGKDWRQEEKGMTEDEMIGWHHQLDGHEFKQGLGVGDGQRSLAFCSPWGHRVGHDWVTELFWTVLKFKLNITSYFFSYSTHLFFITFNYLTCLARYSFPGSTSGKEAVCQCRRCKNPVFNIWSGRFLGGGPGNPLQYFCMDI